MGTRGLRQILIVPIALLLLAFGMSAPAHAASAITGTVTEGGNPSDGATVVLYRLDGGTWQPWDYAYTDTNGDYQFLPPDDAGPSEVFRIGFEKSGWVPEFYNDQDSVDTAADVQAGDIVDADLTSTGRITGTVTEAGAASEGAHVILYRLQGGMWQFWNAKYSDVSGGYELFLPSDAGPSEAFRVGFEKSGWRTEYFDDETSVDSALDLESGDVADADLTAAGRITGTVTEDGSPADGVSVQAYRFDGDQWNPSTQAFTDASGAYELILPGDAGASEDFFIGFEKSGWRTEYFDDTTSLAAADAVQDGDVADADLMPAGRIQGTVTVDGSPAEDATVNVFVDFGGGDWDLVTSTTTDADGKYSVTTGEGQFAVQFVKNNWMPEFYDNQSVIGDADLVSVVDGAPPGAAQYEVDADLAPGTLIEDLAGPLDAEDLAAILAGPGVTVTSVKYAGDDRGAGSFEKFDPLGFNRGIILGSGAVTDTVGPNKQSATSTNMGALGDDDLDTLVAGNTEDASVLEIDFVPSGSKIDFTYVFGSEEYNEWVGSSFDDVFGFFVNGTNCAVVPNTNDRVSVNSINLGLNASLYRDNSALFTGPINVEMDGLTVPLKCSAAVNPGVENTLKLAIADRGDSALDSAVFLQRESLTSNQAPVADGQQVSTPQGVAKALVLSGSDPDGDVLSFQVVSGPSHGTLSGSAPNVTYTPDAGFFGVDEFSFKVSDGQVSSPAASVQITVDKANQPPIVEPEPPVVTPPPQVKPDLAPPGKVTGVKVKRKKTSAIITWDAVPGATSYVVSGPKSVTVTKTKFTLKNLAKTKKYTLKLAAVNSAGKSASVKVTVKKYSGK